MGAADLFHKGGMAGDLLCEVGRAQLEDELVLQGVQIAGG